MLASLPQVLVGSLLLLLSSFSASLGLSSLRYAEMGSSRNLFIVSFSLFLSLSLPEYFREFRATHGHGPFQTSNEGVRDCTSCGKLRNDSEMGGLGLNDYALSLPQSLFSGVLQAVQSHTCARSILDVNQGELLKPW